MSTQNLEPQGSAVHSQSSPFGDSRSQRGGTFVFIDIVNSTLNKTNQSEAGWVTETWWFYDQVRTIATKRCPGVQIKYLGDGILLSYDGEDFALDAVMTAIEVQDAISRASRSQDGGMGTISLDVTIGIASGKAYAFSDANGMPDHIGLVVDRAARLCSAASPNAIFIDRPTYSGTNFLRVESPVGIVFGRTSDDYAGAMQTAALKGLGPVDYHEILWDRTVFGVRSELLTDSTKGRNASAPATGGSFSSSVAVAPRTSSVSARALGRPRAEKLTGKVKCFLPEKKFGFITGSTGEEFYFSPNFLVYPDDVETLTGGTEVAFQVIEAVAENKNRRAAAILVAGQLADGPLVIPPSDGKNYGWIEVKDQVGHGQLVHMTADAKTNRYTRGQILSFRLTIGSRGADATEVEPVEEEQAA